MELHSIYDEEVSLEFVQGEAEGFIRGMETKSVEIAKAMLADGMDINLITKYTGLSVEKLKTESGKWKVESGKWKVES